MSEAAIEPHILAGARGLAARRRSNALEPLPRDIAAAAAVVDALEAEGYRIVRLRRPSGAPAIPRID
jgi:hypothetical protein